MIRNFLSFGLLFLALLLFGSCKTCTTTTIAEKQTDSTLVVRYIERIERDTIQVQLPAERYAVTVTVDTSVLSSSFAISTAWTDTLGLLHHTLENLANTLPVAIDRQIVTRDSIVYRDRETIDYKSISRKGVSRWLLLALGFIFGLIFSIFIKWCTYF